MLVCDYAARYFPKQAEARKSTLASVDDQSMYNVLPVHVRANSLGQKSEVLVPPKISKLTLVLLVSITDTSVGDGGTTVILIFVAKYVDFIISDSHSEYHWCVSKKSKPIPRLEVGAIDREPPAASFEPGDNVPNLIIDRAGQRANCCTGTCTRVT